MDRWDIQPFWQWWEVQMALIEQDRAPALEPEPALRREAQELMRELTGRTQQAADQALASLRYGKRHWNWRR